MQLVAPPVDLWPWIEGGVIVQAPAALRRSCFPGRVTSQLVVRLSGRVRLEDQPGDCAGQRLATSSFIGASAAPTRFLHEGQVAAVGLILRPEAVAGWLGPIGAELAHRVLALDDLLGPRWALVEDAVLHADDDRQRLAILFDALRRAVQHHPRQDERRRQALRLQHEVGVGLGPAHPVDGADQASPPRHLGQRQLQRHFSSTFGLSPKQFQTLCRLRTALHGAVRNADQAAGQGAALAQDAGYCDQSHLARDLRRLAGAPLTELLRQARPAADGFPGEHWPLTIGAAAS